ncbi:MAG: aminodeoxychorismate/anthranilate synthase component II [Deltaproteobacteria bacterium]|nr:aminodeoxychorismate/anthranilate synthase component II [Deltaproteobacteria bacterium]
MKVLLIDNYDSYTYNLYQCAAAILQKEGALSEILVVRRDALDTTSISSYDRIIISPGPGDPSEDRFFGRCAEVIHTYSRSVKTLGVCLGMQGIAHCFGASIIKAPFPMHGKVSKIVHSGDGLFTGVPQGIGVMRYHSLVVDPVMLPPVIEVTAIVSDSSEKNTFDRGSLTERSEIMALRHTEFDLCGVQFHPESFLSEHGEKIMRNFLLSCKF